MIFFFYGPNTYAARQQIAKLAAEYEKKTGSNFGLERIDGAKVKSEELSAALQAAPFLANSRLVIIEELGSNSAVGATIGDQISRIPSTTVAVFYDPAVDQRTVYFKTLKAAAKAIKFEPLPAAKLQQWIAAMAQAQGAEIERPAVGRLLDLAGEDQWRLGHEVEESNTETIFNLVEATTAGKVETALRQYRRLRTEGLSEIYMLSMVIWQLRNLLLAQAAGKTTPAELAKTAGMSPFVAGKMLSKRHLFTEDQLKGAFLQAVDTDYQIKSGVGAADVLVEQLIYRLASRVTV
jgi:DNA polymerase III delta subunit